MRLRRPHQVKYILTETVTQTLNVDKEKICNSQDTVYFVLVKNRKQQSLKFIFRLQVPSTRFGTEMFSSEFLTISIRSTVLETERRRRILLEQNFK